MVQIRTNAPSGFRLAAGVPLRAWLSAGSTGHGAGNPPLFPAISPDQLAPIVRVGTDGERELVMARWGMPGPPQFGGAPITNIRNRRPASVKLRVWATARKLSRWVGSNMTDPVITMLFHQIQLMVCAALAKRYANAGRRAAAPAGRPPRLRQGSKGYLEIKRLLFDYDETLAREVICSQAIWQIAWFHERIDVLDGAELRHEALKALF